MFESPLRIGPIAHSFISELNNNQPLNPLDLIFKHPVLVKSNQKACITISVELNAYFLLGKPSMVNFTIVDNLIK